MSSDKPSLAKIVGANIRRLRKARGLTLDGLADRMNTDIDNASLSRLERGQQGFSANTLESAARALGVEPPALLSLNQEPAVYEIDPQDHQMPAHHVPVVGTAQLGDNGHWTEFEYPTGHGDGFVTYPTKDPNSYAVRVKGDSMRPRIKPGEFVIIEPNTQVHPGDEVLVQTKDGRRMVKILTSRRNGLIELYSINDEHKPITLAEQDVEAIHYVGGIAKAALYYNSV